MNEIQAVTHSGAYNCTCTACTGGGGPETLVDSVADDWAVSPEQASVDPLAGTTAANGKPIWTPQQIAAHLNRTGGGFANPHNSSTGVGIQNNIGDDNNVITFGFFNTQAQLITNGYVYQQNGQLFGLAEYFNFAAFNEAQRAATRLAIGFWDDVVAVSFREAPADDADINFGNLASAPTTQAYARIPTAGLDATLGGQVREIGGDIWVSASQASNFQLTPGGYGLNTLTHEIGHAIGLSHPGAYNAAPGVSITYAANAEYYQDVRNYTIMSYFNPRDTGTRDFNWNVMNIAYGGTPMVHDIVAAQRIYGTDTTTRTGDTTYGFNSNAGKDVFDFTINKAPTVAIWDAGGNDTLDVSGYNTDQIVDLNPGALSSVGGVTAAEAELLTFEQVNANRAAMGYGPIAQATYNANMAALLANPALGRLVDNVGIAYGAWIENAIGGGGNDILVGNDVANVLNGGAGQDTASYRGASAGISFTVGRGGTGAAAGDTYISIERYEGSNHADTLNGGNANDWLSGLGGNDVINGGNGEDTLFGGDGADRIEGGNGSDTISGGAGIDNLSGGNDNDTVAGGADNDTLDGGNGNDILAGDAGDDVLNGGNGNDSMGGGDGNDTINGGNGDDSMTGGIGNDTLNGGNGKDTAIFAGAFSSYHISIANGVVTVVDLDTADGDDGTDTLTGIEALSFGDGDIYSVGKSGVNPRAASQSFDSRLMLMVQDMSAFSAGSGGPVSLNRQTNSYHSYELYA